MPSTPDPQLLTIPEVCKLLRRGRTYVYEQIRTGELPAVDIGGLRVRSADVAAFIDARTIRVQAS